MKIVTYNVNGLRPRVSQFGSLRKLLDALDADIICLQETKLSRHELKADLVRAEGYESFFSCTRTSDKGRTGYSGVATFCRVKSAFSSNEVALPLSAEEGFTGVLENFSTLGSQDNDCQSGVTGLEDFSTDELLKIDGEGRCIITDHGHFVLFNLYGPRAHGDDVERVQFKLKFYNILQRRWETLLGQGKRVLVVGDLNIAPAAIDRCDADSDFEKNQFRTWFRSLLVRNGGYFFDVFREKHPERNDAFTCWPTNSGAEMFNFGSRIDHVLIAGSCLHEEEMSGHNLITCHVKECDILDQFKRWKDGTTPRWKGGKNIKLEGSDHVPVRVSLADMPTVPEHNTPPLSTRYNPQVHGCQQTLVSMFTRKQPAEDTNLAGGCTSASENSIAVDSGRQLMKRPLDSGCVASSDRMHGDVSCTPEDRSEDINESSNNMHIPAKQSQGSQLSLKSFSPVACKKKAKQSQGSQLSLKSFFKKTVDVNSNASTICADEKISQEDICSPHCESNELLGEGGENEAVEVSQPGLIQENGLSQSSQNSNSAFAEWQRIHQLMQSSIPVCKGHKEPCVSRVVKKSGPNLGRRFYVCARAEGPSSNSEANCGYFKWATTKSKQKG